MVLPIFIKGAPVESAMTLIQQKIISIWQNFILLVPDLGSLLRSVVLFHDQSEESDGDRRLQREGWPAGNNSCSPRRRVYPGSTPAQAAAGD